MTVDKSLVTEGLSPQEFDDIAHFILQMRFVLAASNLFMDQPHHIVANKMVKLERLSEKCKILAEYMRHYG